MRLLTLVWINVLLIGCASNKETVLPQAGPTMQAIYQQHMNDLQENHRSLQGHRRLPKEGIAHYRGFVREAANEIDTVFPRLPNPTLVMYVFPHLSHQERTPVPGYATTFPFYERVEYALPGEIPGLPLEPASVASEGASQ
ncbi:TIGR03751 family conjugal transfer lipoprotein [Pseudomaricurvus alkylphenolicus]|nr:TIGR03751 family conjugal transfer lipoprotein [Pseudomaricurvus alkylphenolicus]